MSVLAPWKYAGIDEARRIMSQANALEVELRIRLMQNPDSAANNNNLGLFLRNQCRFGDAEPLLRTAYRLKPDSPDICFNLALVLLGLERTSEAELLLRRACSIRPNFADAFAVLGIALSKQALWDESEKALREAVALKSNDAELHCCLGGVYMWQRRWPEAEAAYGRAVRLNPGAYRAHRALGFLKEKDERFEEAEASFRMALSLSPEDPVASFFFASLLLRQGRFEEGWMRYESRNVESEEWDKDNFCFPESLSKKIPVRKWDNESIAGRSLLVLAEQGLGDAIQFARFMPLLKARGASRLTVVCHPPLVRLVKSVEGIDEVIPATQSLNFAQFERWCYMMSVPHQLGITLENLPAEVPYFQLSSTLERQWREVVTERVPPRPLKVGIAWAGNKNFGHLRPGRSKITDDQQRSIALAVFTDCLKNSGIVFVSLQMGGPEVELMQLPPEIRPIDMMQGVNDLADTAAIIQQLDLVISVDTSVAHLAGALGKPVWILSRYDGDWRWLVDREDSPWYPSARIFRQKRPDDWSDVIASVAQRLRLRDMSSSR